MTEPFTTRQNDLGFQAIRLHYSADPAKTPEWAEKEKKTWANPLKWDQEMEINWWIAAGQRVYPEFEENVHVSGLSHNPRKIIYRAWDFGWHAPACLIAQVNSRDQLLLLREVIGNQETTKQFAERVIQICNNAYTLHAPGYQDFCDPAGQQRKSTSETSEVQDVEVLKALSIHPTWEHGWTRKHGRSLVHQLLQRRTDDAPGLLVDAQYCPVTVQGFLGKYVFPPMKSGQTHDEPDENNHPWADAQAALRYMCTGLYSALGLRRQIRPPAPRKPLTWTGYGTPKPRKGAVASV